MKDSRKNLKVQPATYEILSLIKLPTESFDSVINGLLRVKFQ